VLSARLPKLRARIVAFFSTLCTHSLSSSRLETVPRKNHTQRSSHHTRCSSSCTHPRVLQYLDNHLRSVRTVDRLRLRNGDIRSREKIWLHCMLGGPQPNEHYLAPCKP